MWSLWGKLYNMKILLNLRMVQLQHLSKHEHSNHQGGGIDGENGNHSKFIIKHISKIMILSFSRASGSHGFVSGGKSLALFKGHHGK